MDDLSGLDWSATPSNQSSKPPPVNPPSAFAYPSLRPSPSPFNSGRNTPLSNQQSGSSAVKAGAAKPAQDSFSNLVTFGPAKTPANLSLREQQERLEAEKRRKEDERRKQAQASYGDGRYFDALAQPSTGRSRSSTPGITPPTLFALGAQNGKTVSDDDLFAAFSAETKVDNASHFPPPAQNGSGISTPANAPRPNLRDPSSWDKPTSSKREAFGDDDDPFGLNQLQTKNGNAVPEAGEDEDDDLLGDLGRPVDEVRRKVEAQVTEPEPGKPIEDSESDSEPEPGPRSGNDPFDKAVAKLMDYGFTAENARRGLTESGAGLNVQAAVNWLLDDAHRQAKEKSRGKQAPGASAGAEERSGGRTSSPAWMKDEGATRSRDDRSPAQGEGDLAKTAAAVGSNILKTAGSLWKTGQKKVQRAVQDFQQDGDPGQPKWMRSAQQDKPGGDGGVRRVDSTDEAMMLESGTRPERGQGRSGQDPRPKPGSNASSRSQSPAFPTSRGQVPKWQQAGQPSLLDPRARLARQAADEESAQAYVSPARRRKSPQPPAEQPPEHDLLFHSTAPAPKAPPPQRKPQPPPSAKFAAQPRKAPPAARPPRQIPAVNSFALQSSAKHRAAGTAHFKLGDFAAAHAAYSSSLTGIHPSHPLVIVLLCNRALTALKVGEPRQAVADADAALAIIGPGRGDGESVSLEDGTGEKRDMKDLYGKALSRKAEALEQMEKWTEAGIAWQACVESGVGGPTATAGRQRCQKALAPKPAAKAATPSPRPSAAARPRPRPRPATGGAADSSEAVERLRAANKAAERADDEKFALVDQVDSRLAAWRDGKRDNLRALLGSLENVLWAGSGWKKVGLHELVMANKVKIVYMKAIAKTHPDKVGRLGQPSPAPPRPLPGPSPGERIRYQEC